MYAVACEVLYYLLPTQAFLGQLPLILLHIHSDGSRMLAKHSFVHFRTLTCGAVTHNEAALSLLMTREGKIKRCFIIFKLISIPFMP